MRRIRQIVQITFPVLMVLSCAPTTLTQEQMGKLDPELQRIVSGEDVSDQNLDISVLPDGRKQYGVIIRSLHSDEIRSAGITVGSVFGDVITARVTVEELRELVKLPSVRAVQSSTINFPH